jgi:hypothetical protein
MRRIPARKAEDLDILDELDRFDFAERAAKAMATRMAKSPSSGSQRLCGASTAASLKEFLAFVQ